MINIWHEKGIEVSQISGLLYSNTEIIDINFNAIKISPVYKKNREYEIDENCLQNNYSSPRITIILIEKKLRSHAIYYKSSNIILISLYYIEETSTYEKVARTISKLIFSVIYDTEIQRNTPSERSSFSDILNNNPDDWKRQIISRLDVNPMPSPVHVFMSHGIRTNANWLDKAEVELKSVGLSSSAFRYDWVDLIKFAWNIKIRDHYSKEFLKKIISAKNSNPHKKLSLVAHSFGTLILLQALEFADWLGVRIEIDSVIFNGSIVHQGYNWERFTVKNKNYGVTINRVLNICGSSDIWPVIAKHFIRGAGCSGSFFFSGSDLDNVKNYRIKNGTHASILEKNNVKEIWANYILNESYLPNSQAESPDKNIERINHILAYKCAIFSCLSIFVGLIFLIKIG